MKINFSGKKLKGGDKKQLEQYIKMSASMQLDEHVLQDLEINFIYGSGKCFDAYVEVNEEDFGEEDPRIFDLYVDTQIKDLETLLLTVCHEMVHVKQMALNELTDEGNGRVTWEGFEHIQGTSLAEYYATPWEIEAYGKEKAIYHACKEGYELLEKMVDLNK